jgi:hypothetical protein
VSADISPIHVWEGISMVWNNAAFLRLASFMVSNSVWLDLVDQLFTCLLKHRRGVVDEAFNLFGTFSSP